ncbi:unnamed protein product [Cladocopium goreaui]|uniref:Uncharacterized protein n=1 Tax=Cladocopium goreaui TaxID=2562237 RepID=A0A9P1CYR8_9DINO|nr:unnamed protein product [Cladocopium goreaui]
MPDVLNGKLLSAVHLLHACLDLPTLLSLAFPHSEINDLQGRGGASNVCTGCLLRFLNGTLPFLANCLFPLKPLARMAWFLETVLLPRQLLLASLMHLSCKHLTSDEGYAVGSCLVKGQLQNGTAPPLPHEEDEVWPVFSMRVLLVGELRQFCTDFCSSALVIADVALC